MKRTSLFSALILSAGLLGGTAAIAQEAATAPVPAAQTPNSHVRDHKPLTAEDIKDVGPAYQRLKEAGYTKVGSVHHRGDHVVATVVDKDGNVARVRSEGENGAFTPVERKKEDKHRRGHRADREQHRDAAAKEPAKP